MKNGKNISLNLLLLSFTRLLNLSWRRASFWRRWKTCVDGDRDDGSAIDGPTVAVLESQTEGEVAVVWCFEAERNVEGLEGSVEGKERLETE